MTCILYGIPNCDTVKKARGWLGATGITYTFHDFKKAGVDEAKLAMWCRLHGWQKLLNRAGTTFKKLPDANKLGLDSAMAIRLMVANPSMIKRPVLEHALLKQALPQRTGPQQAGGVLLGFDMDAWTLTLT